MDFILNQCDGSSRPTCKLIGSCLRDLRENEKAERWIVSSLPLGALLLGSDLQRFPEVRSASAPQPPLAACSIDPENQNTRQYSSWFT